MQFLFLKPGTMDEKRSTVRLQLWLTYPHSSRVQGRPDWEVQQELQDHWRTAHTHTSSIPPAQGRRPPWWGRGPQGCCPRCAWWGTPFVVEIWEERGQRSDWPVVCCEDTRRRRLTEIHSTAADEAALKTQVHDSTPWCQSLFLHATMPLNFWVTQLSARTFKLFVISFHQNSVTQ